VTLIPACRSFFRRTAGGQNLHALRGKLLGQFDKPGLVGDGNNGAGDFVGVVMAAYAYDPKPKIASENSYLS